MDLLLFISLVVVTFLPRFLPLFLAERLVLPQVIGKALEYVPMAVLTVIVAEIALVRNQQIDISLTNANLITAFVSVVLALFKIRLFFVVLGGLGTYSAMRLIFSG